MRAREFIVEYKQYPLEEFHGVTMKLKVNNHEVIVYALDDWDNEMGHARLNVGDMDELDPQDLSVDPRYQGQGIAKVMYDYLTSKGYEIHRSYDQTDAGAGFWNKHRGEDVRVWENFGGDIEYRPTPLRMGTYRNPIDPRTGEHNDEFDPKVHKVSYDLADIVDELIENGVHPQVVVVDPETLWATQDWLSTHGSGDDTFADYNDLPVVLKDGNDLNIVDGHHRISRALAKDTPVRVYLFDIQDLD